MNFRRFNKISYYMTLLGWMPFIFVFCFGSNWDINIRLTIAVISIFILLMGAIFHSTIDRSWDKRVIEKRHELDESIKAYKKAKMKLEQYVYDQSKKSNV